MMSFSPVGCGGVHTRRLHVIAPSSYAHSGPVACGAWSRVLGRRAADAAGRAASGADAFRLGAAFARGVGGAGRGVLRVRASARGREDLPKDWTQVVAWARQEFRRVVSSPAQLPDQGVHLAKACMLVALEEEAARSGDAIHPELAEVVLAMTQLRPRSAASASTWSLERLDSLAAEVAALLDSQLEQLHAEEQAVERERPGEQRWERGPGEQAGSEAQAGPGRGEAGAGGPGVLGSSPEASSSSGGSEVGAAGASAAAGAPGGASPGTDPRVASPDVNSYTSFDFEAEQEQLLDRILSSRPGAVGSSSRSTRPGAGGGGSSGTGGGGSSAAGGAPMYYGAAWPRGARGPGGWAYGVRPELYRAYPVQTLSAVNTVLFDRHGYRACNRYGVASDHQLAAVLEGGVGASAALSILYLEVCERLGFPLAARPLEDGRYFVLWPVDAPLMANGQRFLVDPYGRGGLLLLQEVCDIFGVPESALQPASRRELLAALLGELRDTHWSAAVGCSATPGVMTALTVDTALGNTIQVPSSGVRAAALRRTLSACEKRTWLLPEDSEAQLQYGLLLYFSRQYDDAWLELGLYLERFAPKRQPQQQLPEQQHALGLPPQQREQPQPRSDADAGAGRVSTGGAAGEACARTDAAQPLAEGCSGAAEQGRAAAGALAGTAGVPEQGGLGGDSAAGGAMGGVEGVSEAQAARVQMLLEKIRLLLDFAPAPLARG